MGVNLLPKVNTYYKNLSACKQDAWSQANACSSQNSGDNGDFLSIAKSKLTGGSLHFKLLFKIFAYELYRGKKIPLTLVTMDSYSARINNHYYISLEEMINIYNQIVYKKVKLI